MKRRVRRGGEERKTGKEFKVKARIAKEARLLAREEGLIRIRDEGANQKRVEGDIIKRRVRGRGEGRGMLVHKRKESILVKGPPMEGHKLGVKGVQLTERRDSKLSS